MQTDKTDTTILRGGEDLNMKSTPYTEPKTYAFHGAKRCGAKTRAGTACRAPAVNGKQRCRLHGCGKGSGAPRGNRYALIHGQNTAKVKAFRQEVRRILKEGRELTHELS